MQGGGVLSTAVQTGGGDVQLFPPSHPHPGGPRLSRTQGALELQMHKDPSSLLQKQELLLTAVSTCRKAQGYRAFVSLSPMGFCECVTDGTVNECPCTAHL